MRLLLISNSTGPGGGFLDHCEDELLDFLGRGVRILFVPFAGTDGEFGHVGDRRLQQPALGADHRER